MAINVGLLLTHPTQYHSPWFKELAARGEINLKVFYCFQPNAEQQGIGFDTAFEWDVPMFDGYEYAFLNNVARNPGFSFSGCDTPELAGIVASKHFDAWIVNGWKVKSDWQLIKACWKNRLPTLIRGDSHLLDRKSPHVRLAKRLILGRWIPRFERFLTVGKLNEEFYKYYGADPARFFPVRHYVDNERFAREAYDARSQRESLRAKWSIPTQAMTFLFAGKFIDKKQPFEALQAIESLAAQAPHVHLLMVGDGALRDGCERYATEKRLPVSFAGFLNQTEMAQAYACSDVLVVPSSYEETWGLVVNEAMACGLPAIVSDRVGCGPDLICDGNTGSVYRMRDLGQLVNLMKSYATDPSLATRQGACAQSAIRRYSVKAAADNTVAAVQSLFLPSANPKLTPALRSS